METHTKNKNSSHVRPLLLTEQSRIVKKKGVRCARFGHFKDHAPNEGVERWISNHPHQTVTGCEIINLIFHTLAETILTDVQVAEGLIGLHEVKQGGRSTAFCVCNFTKKSILVLYSSIKRCLVCQVVYMPDIRNNRSV